VSTEVAPERLGPLGYGAASVGNLYREVRDDESDAALAAAWDGGIRYFDTAPHYGLGLSERRMGAVLRERPRDELVVSTKVGRLLEPNPGATGDDDEGFAVPATQRRRRDYSRDGVLRSLEESLERMGLDRIDVVFVHDPDEYYREVLDGAYPALHELRDQGVVRAIGAGMNQAEMLTRFVRELDLDLVLMAGRYSLLDQGALAELLPACVERGVAVVIGGVFNSGLLADPRPGATFDYAPAPPELVERAGRLQAVCARHGVPLRAAALAFPFGHPAVASVLVGARTAAEVQDAVAMVDRPVPAELWAELVADGLLPGHVPVPTS
jgi:D-threo-aldose 1-dehydrogenase